MYKELKPYFDNGEINPYFNCPYSWHESYDEYPTCHAESSEDAPCNYNALGEYEPV